MGRRRSPTRPASFGPGRLPGRLDGTFPIKAVLRALWEVPQSPPAEPCLCQQILKLQLSETTRLCAEPNRVNSERLSCVRLQGQQGVPCKAPLCSHTLYQPAPRSVQDQGCRTLCEQWQWAPRNCEFSCKHCPIAAIPLWVFVFLVKDITISQGLDPWEAGSGFLT